METKPQADIEYEPLSYAQQRLWFIDQLSQDGSHYNIPFAIRLRGRLVQAGLQSALDRIVLRHQVLRTSFSEVDGKVRPNVGAARPVPLSIVDLGSCEAGQRGRRMQEVIDREAHGSFDLSADLMLRATLIRLHPGEAVGDHVLLIVFHHVAVDGWSLQLFMKELMSVYTAFCRDAPDSLPPLPLQYADYARWQRQRSKGDWFDEQLSYWRTQLDGVPVVHGLPLDMPRPARQLFDGATHACQLDGSTPQKLRQLGRRHHATLCMVAQAAFVVLLSRWSGQGDIVFGSAVAGRDHQEIESLIGLFAKTLVMRTVVGDDDTLEQVVGKVRDVALDAFDNQDVPFDVLVDVLNPQRCLSHAPVFQIMFSFPKIDAMETAMPGLEVTELATPLLRAKFDLELMVAETAAGLSIGWTYATSLFREETIRRMSNDFVEILERMANDPQQRLCQLPACAADAQAAAMRMAPSREAPPFTEQDKGTGRFDAVAANNTLSKLTDIWATILHRPAASIGYHTSFFDLGGNSLSIIAVRAAIKSALSVEVAVADLFEHATLLRLARFLNDRGDGGVAHLPELQGAKARVLRARSIKLPT